MNRLMMNDSERQARQETGAATAPPPDGSAGVGRGRRSALVIVFLVVFIDLLGFGIVLPLLPLYGEKLLEPLFPQQEKLHGLLLGLLMSTFSAMQFLFAPVWGRLSDRVGRRPILLLGLAGSVAFYALFGIASELGARGWLELGLVLLFVSRLGAGVAGATISTAQAVIADSTPPDRRARGMALIGAAFGIGFTFGPLLGFASLFIRFGAEGVENTVPGAPGFMAAALSLLALLVALRYLPETYRPDTLGLRRRLFDWQGLRNALRNPSVGTLIVTFFLTTVAFGGLESTLALVNKLLLTGDDETRRQLTLEAARTTERKNFLIFAYVGFVLMLTQGLFYRRLVQRVGEVRFLRVGTVLMALGLAGAVVVLLVWRSVESRALLLTIALAVMTFAVIGYALVTPSVHSLISRRTGMDKQGEILGVNQSASALARILGPMVSLALFNLTPSHILPYMFGAGLLVVVFVVTSKLKQE